MTRAQLHDIGGRRAWVIWIVAVLVYVLAVFHRSSLGVAGLIATERFEINGTQLAFFTVLQLVVYAGMQVPVGVMLDRYGSRALLLSGLVTMTLAQLAFAFTTSFGAAVVARAFVGAGDAMVFVCVLRLVSAWFLVRQGSMLAQLTGQIGQLGGVVAAGPLSLLLHEFGWTKAFAAVSMIGVPLLVATACLVKDSPYEKIAPVRIKLRALATSVRSVWGNPGTRLGMWSHFTSQFSMTVFVLLWGYPFLVAGQGLTPTAAGTLLTVMIGWVMVSGIVLGRVVSVVPFYRSWIVVGIVIAIVVTWTVVLLWPGQAPIWLLVVLVCVTASGGPASMVGFDLARTFSPEETLGRANGLVNIGGFVASLMTMALIGIILDLLEPAGATAYDLTDFRVAMCAQYVFWLLGIVQILRYRRKAIAHLERAHPGAVETLKQGEPFVHPGFNDREGV
ncbi:MAG TPA: MFS transporter [Nocardioides sp.]